MNNLTPFQNLVRRWEGTCQDSIEACWCGCGRPETVYMWIRDVLAIAAIEESTQKRAWWDQYPAGVQHILAGVLDSMGLVEHGGSWYSMWLTNAGREALNILSGMTDDDIETALDDAGRVHGCQCYPGPCPYCGRIVAF